MRLMISGGGTGGHVYPALAVVQTLSQQTELLWVGSTGGMEEALLKQADIPFTGISAGGLRGKNPLAALNGLFKLSRGYWQSRTLLKRYQPDVLFVTGGYVCAPVTLAAYHTGIPILIYLPDLEPGQAIRFLSRYANRIAVTAPPAQAFFPAGLSVVTGYPVRPALYQLNKADALAHFGLDSTLPTVLVFGGSQGARSINRALTAPETLTALLDEAQLIHISGHNDADWTSDLHRQLSPAHQQRYHLSPYLHKGMAHAFVAADVIVCRAGASTLGEIPAVGTASILVPYPYSGAHQWANARWLAEQGAAQVIDDADLATQLGPAMLNLLRDVDKRNQMGKTAHHLAQPRAAQAIAEVIEELVDVRDN